MAELTRFEVASIVSARTKEGAIEVTWNGETMQIPLPKAREIIGMLQAAVEAAISDQLLFLFLTKNVGLSEEGAARALVDFRELRQGTRKIVYPS